MNNKPEEQGFKQGFGKSEATVCLASMLLKPEYEKYKGCISALLQDYNHTINEIDFSNLDHKIKIQLIILVRNELKKTLFKIKSTNIPQILKNFIFNIFSGNCKMAIKNKHDRNDVSKKYYGIKNYEIFNI